MPGASASAQTRFGLGGYGERRAGSFAGKTPNVVIPYIVQALGFYVGGPVAGDYHSGGAAKAGYSTGGAVAGQMAPLGGS